jgi:hypothetical protein
MTKRKGEGPYHNNLDKERVTEMDTKRTKNFTCEDGVSFADVVDRNSTEDSNWGLAASIKRKR